MKIKTYVPAVDQDVVVPDINIEENDAVIVTAQKPTIVKYVFGAIKSVQENFFYIYFSWLYKIINAVYLSQYGFSNEFFYFLIVNEWVIGSFGVILIISAPIDAIYNCCKGKGCRLSTRVLMFTRILGVTSSLINIILIQFYMTCAEDGYVMTDDYNWAHNNKTTKSWQQNRHKLVCTQFATWGTFASLAMDVCMLLKGVLNFWGMRKSAYIMMMGVPITFFWFVPLVIDIVFFLLSCGKWGFLPLTKPIISYIDDRLTNSDDDWI
jgi:hypothetical protein